jgi:hypothetical protein
MGCHYGKIFFFLAFVWLLLGYKIFYLLVTLSFNNLLHNERKVYVWFDESSWFIWDILSCFDLVLHVFPSGRCVRHFAAGNKQIGRDKGCKLRTRRVEYSYHKSITYERWCFSRSSRQPMWKSHKLYRGCCKAEVY